MTFGFGLAYYNKFRLRIASAPSHRQRRAIVTWKPTPHTLNGSHWKTTHHTPLMQAKPVKKKKKELILFRFYNKRSTECVLNRRTTLGSTYITKQWLHGVYSPPNTGCRVYIHLQTMNRNLDRNGSAGSHHTVKTTTELTKNIAKPCAKHRHRGLGAKRLGLG